MVMTTRRQHLRWTASTIAAGLLSSAVLAGAATAATATSASRSAAPKTAASKTAAQKSAAPKTAAPKTAARASTAACARTGPRRIMPLGDSLTVGMHWNSGNDDSYRPYLWRRLQAAGVTDIDFVGPLRTGDNSTYDGDHAGFGGFTIGPDNGFPDAQGKLTNNLYSHIVGFVRWQGAKNETTGQDIVTVSDPDIVLLNIGTNDAELDPAKIYSRLEALVRLIRSKQPDAIVVVSSVTPSDVAALDLVGPQAKRLADASDGRVVYADIRTRMVRGDAALGAAPFTPADWESPTDRHLSVSGGQKFAAAWYPTVIQVLGMPRCRPR